MARPRRRAVLSGVRPDLTERRSALAVRRRRRPLRSTLARVTCRLEVFVRSGHTIDLALEDGEDRVFVSALHDAWASPDAIEFKQLALGQHAVILAGEVVGYRLHGSVRPGSAL